MKKFFWPRKAWKLGNLIPTSGQTSLWTLNNDSRKGVTEYITEGNYDWAGVRQWKIRFRPLRSFPFRIALSLGNRFIFRGPPIEELKSRQVPAATLPRTRRSIKCKKFLGESVYWGPHGMLTNWISNNPERSWKTIARDFLADVLIKLGVKGTLYYLSVTKWLVWLFF